MNGMRNTVFQRTAEQSTGPVVSTNIYNLVIGLVLCWGFFINWLIVKNVPYEAVAGISPLLFILLFFGLSLTGAFIFNRSANPFISFIGYNLVVLPFGLVIDIIVHQYDPNVVLEAIRVTGIVTAVMMVLGSMFPAFFKKIAGALLVALIAVIIVELVEVFFFGIHHGIIDWIVALIFCGYIGFDWARANSIPKTIDNAVDSAASLYIDIINLFIRILAIMGRRE